MQTKVASSHDRISPTGSKYEESRNDWIIWMSKEKLINSIDFMEFVNIKQVAFGGSGVIQKALWKTKTEQKYVILKQVLHDSSKMEKLEQDELVKEVKALHHISKMKTNAETGDTDHKYIVEFFAFPEFYLVLEYADRGDLRNYLCRNNLEWKCKVDISRHIAHGLRFLHKNEILHRDLHTGNVVIKSDNNTQFEDIVSGEVWKEMNEPKTELNEHGRYKNLLDNASTEYEFKNVKDAFDRFSTEHPAPIYHSIQILLSIGNWIFYLRIFENRNSNKPE
ncbi:37002_t:CDS:2 [Gigaspora margarita]|uniref:37002_t:CDS:1 n=1 Tax=Gigaspora margarita TaxID=4874 RepID=A0ABM8W2T3_GIGMA|nr:37002_t:CDS:2 [Gigaspora margarita]